MALDKTFFEDLEARIPKGKVRTRFAPSPSGDLTLGSYLGAIRNWAALADEYDCYYMMADMHTITVRQVPAELRRHPDRNPTSNRRRAGCRLEFFFSELRSP